MSETMALLVALAVLDRRLAERGDDSRFMWGQLDDDTPPDVPPDVRRCVERELRRREPSVPQWWVVWPPENGRTVLAWAEEPRRGLREVDLPAGGGA